MFESFESGSIQQLIYQTGTKMLSEMRDLGGPPRGQQHLDPIAEHPPSLGIYTEARPPYGVLGLSLKREQL